MQILFSGTGFTAFNFQSPINGIIHMLSRPNYDFYACNDFVWATQQRPIYLMGGEVRLKYVMSSLSIHVTGH